MCVLSVCVCVGGGRFAGNLTLIVACRGPSILRELSLESVWNPNAVQNDFVTRLSELKLAFVIIFPYLVMSLFGVWWGGWGRGVSHEISLERAWHTTAFKNDFVTRLSYLKLAFVICAAFHAFQCVPLVFCPTEIV